MVKKKLRDGRCKGKAHYWVLDDKNLGVCKKCGAKKQFVFQGWGQQKHNFTVGKKLHHTKD